MYRYRLFDSYLRATGRPMVHSVKGAPTFFCRDSNRLSSCELDVRGYARMARGFFESMSISHP